MIQLTRSDGARMAITTHIVECVHEHWKAADGKVFTAVGIGHGFEMVQESYDEVLRRLGPEGARLGEAPRIAGYLGADAEKCAHDGGGARFFDLPTAGMDRKELFMVIGWCMGQIEDARKQQHIYRAEAIEALKAAR